MSKSSLRRKFRNRIIQFRISEQEGQLLDKFASEVGLTTNELVRSSTFTYLNQVLQKAEQMRKEQLEAESNSQVQAETLPEDVVKEDLVRKDV